MSEDQASQSEGQKGSLDQNDPAQVNDSARAKPDDNPLESDMADFKAILAPIKGDNPCGDGKAARYDDAYENLETEIGKLVAISQDVAVDWGKVKSMSETYLCKKAIDLLVANYFCFSLFAIQGYAGLNAGVACLIEIIKKYWQGLFPPLKRMGGRVAAIEWLIDRLEVGLEKRKPNSQELGQMANLLLRLDEFDELLTSLFATDKPDIFSIRRQIQTHKDNFERAQRQVQIQKQQKEKQDSKPSGSSAGGEEIATDVNSEDDIENILGVFETAMNNIAEYYRKKDLLDPRGYLYNRYGAWLPIDDVPANQDGITQLTAPRPELIQGYESELDDGNYKDVVKELEEELTSNPFWLGSQRIVCQALDRLGPNYLACKNAVQDSLVLFVRRLPQLYETKFADGTPFIDAETQTWIEQEVMGSYGAGGGGGLSLGGEADAPWLEIYHEAKSKAASGDFAAGLKLFKEGQAKAGSKRENFIWRIYQSRYSLDGGQLELAIGQLDSLDKQVRQLGLDEWEPQLSVEVARLLLHCYSKYMKKRQKMLPELAEKMEDLYGRICRLDINTALTIEDKPWQA